MKKLFLIGNGFDLAHKIPSSYEDFHNFLKEEYTNGEGDSGVIPQSFMLPDGGEDFNDEELVMFLRLIISNAEELGEKWADVETSLGKLDYSEFLDDWSTDDEDDNEWHEVYRNEDNASALFEATRRIQYFFNMWIKSIDISEVLVKTDFSKLIDKEKDLFLTFNYTKTLEKLYNSKNVCHIHGEQDGKIYFGHGDKTDHTEYYERNHIGSGDTLCALDEQLRKKTEDALIDNQWFFNSIDHEVSEIYSFGFSFSDVDLVYLKEILGRLDTKNLTWHLNDYSYPTEINRYKNIITNCGFEGEFSTYHIN